MRPNPDAERQEIHTYILEENYTHYNTLDTLNEDVPWKNLTTLVFAVGRCVFENEIYDEVQLLYYSSESTLSKRHRPVAPNNLQ